MCDNKHLRLYFLCVQKCLLQVSIPTVASVGTDPSHTPRPAAGIIKNNINIFGETKNDMKLAPNPDSSPYSNIPNFMMFEKGSTQMKTRTKINLSFWMLVRFLIQRAQAHAEPSISIKRNNDTSKSLPGDQSIRGDTRCLAQALVCKFKSNFQMGNSLSYDHTCAFTIINSNFYLI